MSLSQGLNQWIYQNTDNQITTNGGAYFWADTATAVTDPNNPQNTNPTYLTNGTPNATYYTKIAKTIADAIYASENNIPPTPLSAVSHHL